MNGKRLNLTFGDSPGAGGCTLALAALGIISYARCAYEMMVPQVRIELTTYPLPRSVATSDDLVISIPCFPRSTECTGFAQPFSTVFRPVCRIVGRLNLILKFHHALATKQFYQRWRWSFDRARWWHVYWPGRWSIHRPRRGNVDWARRRDVNRTGRRVVYWTGRWSFNRAGRRAFYGSSGRNVDGTRRWPSYGTNWRPLYRSKLSQLIFQQHSAETSISRRTKAPRL